ncbi:MAG: hypothetical protein ABJH63_07885 [Rhizobiaceae bacterium]
MELGLLGELLLVLWAIAIGDTSGLMVSVPTIAAAAAVTGTNPKPVLKREGACVGDDDLWLFIKMHPIVAVQMAP